MKGIRRALLSHVVLGAALGAPAACGGGADEVNGVNAATAHGGLIGNPAPDFEAKRVGSANGKVSLRALRGMVVLVDFWGTFCEPCKKSFPKLEQLNAEFAGEGLRIVGISEDEPEDKDKIPTFAEAYGVKFMLAWDENRSAARAFKPETMPSSFLIDRNGIVRFAHVGYHDGEEVDVEKQIRELLAQ